MSEDDFFSHRLVVSEFVGMTDWVVTHGLSEDRMHAELRLTDDFTPGRLIGCIHRHDTDDEAGRFGGSWVYSISDLSRALAEGLRLMLEVQLAHDLAREGEQGGWVDEHTRPATRGS